MAYFRRILPILAALLIGGLAWYNLGDAATWRTSNVRGLLFSADRGVTSDSVMQLSDATYYPVADTSGAVFYTKAGGTNIVVTTRRKWMTSSNATIRAYPSYLAIADTAGQGVDASYIGGNRYQWYLGNADFGLWDFYEIGGAGADSAIAELQNVVVIGETLPDSSVTRAALEDQAVSLAKVDSSGVIAFQNIRVHGRIYGDSLFAVSATGPSVVLGAVEDSSGSFMVDTLTVEHDLVVKGDAYLGDAVDDTVYVQGTLDAVQTVRITTNGLQADFWDTYDASLMEIAANPADSLLISIPTRIADDLEIDGSLDMDGTITASLGDHTIFYGFPDSFAYGRMTVPTGPNQAKRRAVYKVGVRADWQGVCGYCDGDWYTGYYDTHSFTVDCVQDSVIISCSASSVSAAVYVCYWVHNTP